MSIAVMSRAKVRLQCPSCRRKAFKREWLIADRRRACPSKVGGDPGLFSASVVSGGAPLRAGLGHEDASDSPGRMKFDKTGPSDRCRTHTRRR